MHGRRSEPKYGAKIFKEQSGVSRNAAVPNEGAGANGKSDYQSGKTFKVSLEKDEGDLRGVRQVPEGGNRRPGAVSPVMVTWT